MSGIGMNCLPTVRVDNIVYVNVVCLCRKPLSQLSISVLDILFRVRLCPSSRQGVTRICVLRSNRLLKHGTSS